MRLVTKVLAMGAVLFVTASVALGAVPVTVVDDNDWRPPATVSRAEGIECEMTPALVLKTEFKDPAFLFDPTDDETITHITDFRGKLYLASCTQPAATDTGSVYTYDPDTNEWQKVFTVNDQGLVRLEVYGDRLYIAGYDANDGGWDLGNIYVHDGTTWVEHRTVPRAIHEYGLAVYNGRLYVSGAILDPPPAGVTVDEAAEKGLTDVYGRVVSSDDGGLTWREEYRGPQPGQDIGFMTVFQDKLVVNSHGDLVTFDGKRWRKLGLNPDALIVFDYAGAGDTLLLGTSLGLGFFDGKHFKLAEGARGRQVRAISRLGSCWVLAEYGLTGGSIHHGPGMMSYPSSPGKSREPFYSGVRVVPDELMQRTAQGRVGRSTSGRQVQWAESKELLTSAHAFHGRVYLGAHPEGRVLVLPVVKEGTLESAPRPVLSAGTYTLSWEAATPTGTSCRLQIRTALTREALEKQPFVGPDANQASYFDVPGAALRIAQPGFVQYRVLLKTENPAVTPYLKRVTLRSGA
jgi:hypothetical protein